MRPDTPRKGVLLTLMILSPIPAWPQDPPPAKDPWTILDGTYYAPGTSPIPTARSFPDREAVKERAVDAPEVALKGEWVALAQTYRESLERLGEEDADRLLDVVADLEVAAIANQPDRRMQRLARVQLTVARELARQDPEMLVPVFQLHHDLYRKHRENRQWYLLLHSVSMVEELAQLYVDRAGSKGSRINAARILASLAGYLQAAQQPSSVRIFGKVLELDPTNETAYLSLAAHYEKRGGPFELVVKELRELLEIYPEHREGRLRLAVNYLRLEKEKEGRALFQDLVNEPASDWVYRLAAQELARYEMSAGRIESSIAVLEQAIGNAPGDQKLHIQLAFLYDRARRSFDAHRAAEVARKGAPATEPPRGRYNTWPHEALDREREELRRLAASRAQLLARLLRSPQGADGEASHEPELQP